MSTSTYQRVPCIVCGEPATWSTLVPDDENAEHPTYACDEHLVSVLRRQYTGDVLVCERADDPDDTEA